MKLRRFKHRSQQKLKPYRPVTMSWICSADDSVDWEKACKGMPLELQGKLVTGDIGYLHNMTFVTDSVRGL